MKALQSALNQTQAFTRILVSDSSQRYAASIQSAVSDLIVGGCPVDLGYARRPYTNSFAQNWLVSIKEVDSDWVVFHHDDDLLLPDYVKVISNRVCEAPLSVVAIAPNAEIISESGASLGVYRRRGRFQRVRTREAVLKAYFFSMTSRPPPFPSYCYRSNVLKDCPLIDAGRLSDVLLVLRLSEIGAVEWLPEVLFQYRIQPGQDTHAINASDLAQFVEVVGKSWPRLFRFAFFTWLVIRLLRRRIFRFFRFHERSK